MLLIGWEKTVYQRLFKAIKLTLIFVVAEEFLLKKTKQKKTTLSWFLVFRCGNNLDEEEKTYCFTLIVLSVFCVGSSCHGLVCSLRHVLVMLTYLIVPAIEPILLLLECKI